MFDFGLTRLVRCPAIKAGRLASFLLRMAFTIPLWLAHLLLVLILPFGRVLVQIPLALAVVGGLGASTYFALAHAWSDVLSAFVVVIIASVALVGFTAVAELIDPDFSRPARLPPWWWDF